MRVMEKERGVQEMCVRMECDPPHLSSSCASLSPSLPPSLPSSLLSLPPFHISFHPPSPLPLSLSPSIFSISHLPPPPPPTLSLPSGLPNEAGRLEILHIHTTAMRSHGKLDSKVDLEYLASKTRNFSGAEIEGLVRSAQATAMNKIIKVRISGVINDQWCHFD